MIYRATIIALTTILWLGLEPASAGILELRAQLQAGGAGGTGVSGAQMDNAFHAGTSGAAYGAIVGAEIVFLDAWIEHNQFQGADGLLGTWTQFMAGVDLNVDLGDKDGGGGYFAELGVGVGFGVGTGQQVDPPLDNSEVTDKGFLVQGHVAVGYRLSKMLSVGVMVPLQGGYMFKSGPGLVANDEGTQYVSMQAAALVNLRVDVPLK